MSRYVSHYLRSQKWRKYNCLKMSDLTWSKPGIQYFFYLKLHFPHPVFTNMTKIQLPIYDAHFFWSHKWRQFGPNQWMQHFFDLYRYIFHILSSHKWRKLNLLRWVNLAQTMDAVFLLSQGTFSTSCVHKLREFNWLRWVNLAQIPDAIFFLIKVHFSHPVMSKLRFFSIHGANSIT